MHFRHRRIGAANGEEREQREMPGQRPEDSFVLHRRSHHASAIESGARTRSTHCSGQRSRPMATKQATAITGPGPILRNTGSAIFATVAKIKPEAAAAMPARM